MVKNFSTNFVVRQRGTISFGGVKNFAILDKLNSYNILNRQPPDIMHEMLEGSIPLNFYYMMVKFKKDKVMRVVTLDSEWKNPG